MTGQAVYPTGAPPWALIQWSAALRGAGRQPGQTGWRDGEV